MAVTREEYERLLAERDSARRSNRLMRSQDTPMARSRAHKARRRRALASDVGRLSNEAAQRQAIISNSPIGSVGAPGGVLEMPDIGQRERNKLTRRAIQDALDVASLIPIAGELADPIAAAHYIHNFGDEDPLGAQLSASALMLPGVAGVVARKGKKGINKLWKTGKQAVSSAATSINKSKLPASVNRLLKEQAFVKGGINVDIGGGKFDNMTDRLKQDGVTI